MGVSKIKYFFISFFLFFLLNSCNQGANEVKNDSQEEIINDSTEVQDSIEMQMKALADSLDMVGSSYDDLMKSKKGTDYRNSLYLRKIHLLESENDSLKTQLNILRKDLEALANSRSSEEPKSVLNKSQKDVQNMILAMNSSWVRMYQTRKPKEVLKYFLPRFLVSRISVEIDNTANAAMYQPNDFAKFLKDLNNKNDLVLEFADVNFYHIEVKSGTYFNAAYKCKLKIYKGDKLQYDNSVLVTMTGRKLGKKWKIATLSWVGFKYDASKKEEKSDE